jgi:hypothetical protein
MASIATDEDVVNIALSRIGAKSISTLASDTTVEAVQARIVYYNTRDSLMRAHPWNFLTLRVQLTDSGTDPVFGWDNGFLLPSDFLRLITVHATNDNWDQPPYRLEKQDISAVKTNVLLINSSTCWIRYVYLETTPSKWITDFQDAVAWQLAAEFALVLPVSGTKYDLLEKRAERALLYAKSIDGMEDYPERMPEGSWVTDREHGQDWGE